MVMAKRGKKISTPFSVLAPPPGGAKNTLGVLKIFGARLKLAPPSVSSVSAPVKSRKKGYGFHKFLWTFS